MGIGEGDNSCLDRDRHLGSRKDYNDGQKGEDGVREEEVCDVEAIVQWGPNV
jgi:hypothetical protein